MATGVGFGVVFVDFAFFFFAGAFVTVGAGARVTAGETAAALVGTGLACGVAPGVGTVTVSTVLTRPVGSSSVGCGGGPGAKRPDPSEGPGG